MPYASGTKTRERLLDVAIEVVRAEGASGLTLDGVARGAGVSKGGLLHHFRTKEALIEALLRQLFADFDAAVTRHYEEDAPAPGRWCRAYVRATFDDDPLPLELVTLLFGGIADHEALLALVRDDSERWGRRLADDGLPPARAAIIRRAADATWLERALGAPAESPEARRAVRGALLDLTLEGSR